MNSYSPYGSTPGGEYYHEREAKYASPSPTPSPGRGPYYYAHAQTPQRPATRAHFRHMSSGLNDFSSPRAPAFSPRFTSDGHYATANRERRSSFSYYRASDNYGDSDEDEYIEINGVTYVLPARSNSRRHRDYYYTANYGGHTTDRHYRSQGPPPTPQPHRYEKFEREFRDIPPRHEPDLRRAGHTRRSSTSVPQRPQTARPSSSNGKRPPPAAPKATEADAKKHRIPAGYSLKNWDPTEEPIMLLGSVFDANSLGKWIYDWTVYRHGPNTPISDMAGELWLLLIQLAGKMKRSEDVIPKIRSLEKKELVEDFIEGGERLTDKLRKLLKACESPMLKASKAKDSQLGKNAGIEFVETLFGRERELERTERFMQSVRTWNVRFDANCEEILRNPTK
ncbi:Vegetative cell wall protein gp1 [Pleurostoma richardsiae]|uniref:Vegetative cell wall protein gp1 n=1 Tax=Pleurostoma richardsiae TaxID=41990 RepID=A0AA38RNC3_9PEZI|nr:Vegetative cell wall protein gp1 [Pleurostoma richardsiae]